MRSRFLVLVLAPGGLLLNGLVVSACGQATTTAFATPKDCAYSTTNADYAGWLLDR